MLLRRPKSGTVSSTNGGSGCTEDEVQNRQIVLYRPKTNQRAMPSDFVTWSQVAPNVVQGVIHDPQQYYDPYDATHAAPEHFISGLPMIKFRAKDPTIEEANKFRNHQLTPLWREQFRDFTKWSDMHKEAQYDGEEEISAVFRWSTSMKARFLAQGIENAVAKAELAAATFMYRARQWWLAHRTRAPKLLVTFDQMVEWIKRELVPFSSTSDAVNAWSELTYHGDPKKYVADLDRTH